MEYVHKCARLPISDVVDRLYHNMITCSNHLYLLLVSKFCTFQRIKEAAKTCALSESLSRCHQR